jgi:antitoxin (DNA-binding transcriptional repressor) of toxin-antitoxin stability system
MSINVTIEEAQAKLPEIIGTLAPGDEVVITKGNQPVAELRAVAAAKPRPQFGSCRGMLTIVAEDDEHLKDFKEYMP